MRLSKLNLLDFKRKLNQSNHQLNQQGFTLIELLVVVIMIGILAGIAVPGWLGFVKQRRANTANDYILQSLQKAQTQAKKQKISYSVSFRKQDGLPQIAVHPTSIPATNDTDMEPYWIEGDFAKNFDLQPNQIVVQTNLAENQAAPNLQENEANLKNTSNTLETIEESDDPYTITFDYLGVLEDQNGAPPDVGLYFVSGVPKNDAISDPQPGTIKCIAVETIMGSLRIGRDEDECDPSNSETNP